MNTQRESVAEIRKLALGEMSVKAGTKTAGAPAPIDVSQSDTQHPAVPAENAA